MTPKDRIPADDDGRRRVVIEGVEPEIDGGRFPVKRVAGEPLVVEADAFTDGHDAIRCQLLHRRERQRRWRRSPMEPLGNDRWRGSAPLEEPGVHLFTVEAWVDPFLSWHRDLGKRVKAGQDVGVDLRIGAEHVAAAAGRADGTDARRLRELAELLEETGRTEGGVPAEELPEPVADALAGELPSLMERYPDRSWATRYPRELEVTVDRERARFSAWYEFFPRSTGPGAEHGTFGDAERRLPYVRDLGFDIVYLPPIHPVGRDRRKGRNNATEAEPGDVGSPWAIGADEGGHTAVHPDLGTLADFRSFRKAAEKHGLEVALDIAFQCAPDHPWVEEHPDWFRHRPDGTIQYAENPPKKYQDIYPFDFESDDWENLWRALRDVFLFWMEQGVRIFRVDNPHTKPFPFWEWVIGELKREDPGVILLSEAFTRPKVMYRLAKLGFTQSYTYFAWRHTAWDLREYLTELTQTKVREFFRPSFWPNTPDILTEYLQTGGRPGFMIRGILAATLTASYGVYGPAFELLAHEPREPGSEEYLDSEKYQVREWDLERPDSLRDLLARLNRIRRDNPALQRDDTLRFHATDNEQILAYSKRSLDGSNTVLTVVNLDPHHTQSGWVDLRLDELDLRAGETYPVQDMLGGGRFLWSGARNFVLLDPVTTPAHVFRLALRTRSETDFDYYM